jgi:uncharacterized protein (DUF1330 family)
MAKGYWVVTYRSIKNAGAFEAYAKRAVPALQAEGGRFIVRGMPTKIYEAGMNERVVVIEFDDIAGTYASWKAPHKSRLSGNGWLTSALPPKAAVERTSVDVSNVPRADLRRIVTSSVW